MRNRIAILVILALAAAACLLVSVYWARMESVGLPRQHMDRFDYLAHYWLIAFAILASAWVVLLVKTVREGPDHDAEER